jgi:nitrogen PTS system EIIA component
MNFEAMLSLNDVMTDVIASDKATLIQELSARAALGTGLDRVSISAAILKREELGSTGLGAGVAIPHAIVPGLSRPFGILARLKRALDFAAIDEQPVDIVFLLLLPHSPGSDQNSALAAVARELRNPAIVLKLRKARDKLEAYQALLTS